MMLVSILSRGHSMHNIHKLSNLPNQKTINSIALLGHQFISKELEFDILLIQLEELIAESNFMIEHDNSAWMEKRGHDFINNPKLFAQAPLTYVCAFLSELFKNSEADEIESSVQPIVIYQALKRLQDFKLH